MMSYNEMYETPNDFVDGLGWIWDEENKYFKHPKSDQIFYAVYLNWNKQRWVVPVYTDENVPDKVTSRTFKYEVGSGGSSYKISMNNSNDFKDSRRGKRYNNYMRYMKRRERKKKSFTSNNSI